MNTTLTLKVDIMDILRGLDMNTSNILLAMAKDEEEISGDTTSLIAAALKECAAKVKKIEDVEYNEPMEIQVPEELKPEMNRLARILREEED